MDPARGTILFSASLALGTATLTGAQRLLGRLMNRPGLAFTDTFGDVASIVGSVMRSKQSKIQSSLTGQGYNAAKRPLRLILIPAIFIIFQALLPLFWSTIEGAAEIRTFLNLNSIAISDSCRRAHNGECPARNMDVVMSTEAWILQSLRRSSSVPFSDMVVRKLNSSDPFAYFVSDVDPKKPARYGHFVEENIFPQGKPFFFRGFEWVRTTNPTFPILRITDVDDNDVLCSGPGGFNAAIRGTSTNRSFAAQVHTLYSNPNITQATHVYISDSKGMICDAIELGCLDRLPQLIQDPMQTGRVYVVTDNGNGSFHETSSSHQGLCTNQDQGGDFSVFLDGFRRDFCLGSSLSYTLTRQDTPPNFAFGTLCIYPDLSTFSLKEVHGVTNGDYKGPMYIVSRETWPYIALFLGAGLSFILVTVAQKLTKSNQIDEFHLLGRYEPGCSNAYRHLAWDTKLTANDLHAEVITITRAD